MKWQQSLHDVEEIYRYYVLVSGEEDRVGIGNVMQIRFNYFGHLSTTQFIQHRGRLGIESFKNWFLHRSHIDSLTGIYQNYFSTSSHFKRENFASVDFKTREILIVPLVFVVRSFASLRRAPLAEKQLNFNWRFSSRDIHRMSVGWLVGCWVWPSQREEREVHQKIKKKISKTFFSSFLISFNCCMSERANNESASCQKQIRKPAESGLVLIISLEVNWSTSQCWIFLSLL